MFLSWFLDFFAAGFPSFSSIQFSAFILNFLFVSFLVEQDLGMNHELIAIERR
jgi:hypothetical protein